MSNASSRSAWRSIALSAKLSCRCAMVINIARTVILIGGELSPRSEDYRCDCDESLVMVVMNVVAMVKNWHACVQAMVTKTRIFSVVFDRSSFVNKSYFSNLGLREA